MDNLNIMHFKTILTRLYCMLVYADGNLNEREISFGQVMKSTEHLAEGEFSAQIEALKTADQSLLFSDCLAALKKLDRKLQVRCVAWLCLVANADGFMDKAEWQFIYTVYHKSLNLPLEEIMITQKQLNKISRENFVSH